jgi:hypothetical protein
MPCYVNRDGRARFDYCPACCNECIQDYEAHESAHSDHVTRLEAERDALLEGLVEALALLHRVDSDLATPDDGWGDENTWCAVCGRWLDIEMDGYVGHAPGCRYVALCELARFEVRL